MVTRPPEEETASSVVPFTDSGPLVFACTCGLCSEKTSLQDESASNPEVTVNRTSRTPIDFLEKTTLTPRKRSKEHDLAIIALERLKVSGVPDGRGSW
jgi:hypothetical protein